MNIFQVPRISSLSRHEFQYQSHADFQDCLALRLQVENHWRCNYASQIGNSSGLLTKSALMGSPYTWSQSPKLNIPCNIGCCYKMLHWVLYWIWYRIRYCIIEIQDSKKLPDQKTWSACVADQTKHTYAPLPQPCDIASFSTTAMTQPIRTGIVKQCEPLNSKTHPLPLCHWAWWASVYDTPDRKIRTIKFGHCIGYDIGMPLLFWIWFRVSHMFL